MDKVFISIINFNGRENTIACLDSIKKLSRKNFNLTVYIIDNASEEKINIKEDYLGDIELKIFENKENLGFSGGHNFLFKEALKNDADYIIVLNNDIVIDENLIEELLKTAKKENAGVICPKIYFAKGFEYHKERYKNEDLGNVFWYAGGKMDWGNVIASHRGVDEVDSGQYDNEEETAFATGCCMLIAKRVFEKIGFFDEKYFLYYEDNDFCQRAKKDNFKIYYSPKAVLWHKNAGSAGGSGSILQDYFITRNRLLFGIKFAPLRSKIALFKESLIILLQGRQWQKKGILDFYLGNFGKGSFNK